MFDQCYTKSRKKKAKNRTNGEKTEANGQLMHLWNFERKQVRSIVGLL